MIREIWAQYFDIFKHFYEARENKKENIIVISDKVPKDRRKPKVTITDYFILIYLPEHPRAMGKGYVPEQILVAEKEMGRNLSPDEDVRHINGDVHDNRPSNLEVISANSGYKTRSILESSLQGIEDSRKPTKDFMPCRFQKQCWKEVRLPIVKREKIYLPYICSYQSLSDVYSCGIFWNYIDKENDEKVEEGVG